MKHNESPGRRERDRVGLGLIGVGAFGAFMVPHLRPFFDVVVHDPRPDLPALAAEWGLAAVDLASAAARRIVVLAVPLARLDAVARAIAPHLGPRTLVVDVCSVKMRPLETLKALLPADARIVGTHPLFGPQSGRAGIAGRQAVVCAEGAAGAALVRFLARRLDLDVVEMTAEDHDRQAAHVQGLSHLVARGLMGLRMPGLVLRTAASAHLDEIVDLLGSDSDALFHAIVGGNPFAEPLLRRFLAETENLVARATSA